MRLASDGAGIEPVPALAGTSPQSAGSIVDRANDLVAVASAIATGLAGCVLTWEASARYFFKIPSDWQDELSVFLLVGATFMSAAWVQARRGHVGINALAAILPPGVERIRGTFADLATFLFCAFFCWKTWTLLLEALDESTHSNSSWGPPLWIPYSLMAVGMTLLALQTLLQCLARVPGVGTVRE
jgi:TRAP-type C4-dicarboxylate transport system permease small subunit